MKKLIMVVLLLAGIATAQDLAVKSKITPDKKAPIKLDVESPADSIYLECDKMPEPVGGFAAIMGKVVYPKEAMEAKIQGMVVVSGVINEKGNVTSVKVEKSLGYGCDEAAMKALKETKFTPGENKGKLVKVRVALPVKFQLQ